jgi:hypothetical protein
MYIYIYIYIYIGPSGSYAYVHTRNSRLSQYIYIYIYTYIYNIYIYVYTCYVLINPIHMYRPLGSVNMPYIYTHIRNDRWSERSPRQSAGRCCFREQGLSLFPPPPHPLAPSPPFSLTLATSLLSPCAKALNSKSSAIK